MGRGGGGRGRGGGGGGGDKTENFFRAIEIQKEETVRWSLLHGGLAVTSSNEAGQTGIMAAAAGGKEKSLYVLLDQVRRMRGASDRAECLNAKDEENRTALMLAAMSGRFECVQMLKEAGARLDLRDDSGYTARQWADWSGKTDIVDYLDGKEVIVDDGPDSAADSDGGFEGETSTQRSKRKKKERMGNQSGGLTCSQRREAGREKGDKGDDDKPLTQDDKGVEPVLKEIADALAVPSEGDKIKELTLVLKRTEESQYPGIDKGEMDPALWRLGPTVRHLDIRWRPGLSAGSLDRVSALNRVLHLIIQDSSLPALPDCLGELKELRSLEVDGNLLKTFPDSIGKLASGLQVLSAVGNKLNAASLKKLAPLDHLVSLKLDKNVIADLEDLALNKKPHLVTLSVTHNELVELPEDPWADLVMLQHLNVTANKIKELPFDMGAMKEKKLTELILDDNPWKDGKIRTMIDNSAVLSNTVLVYLRKLKPKGGKKPKGKPKKKSKAESESEDESEDDAPAAKDESSEEEAPPPLAVSSGKKKKGKK